MPRSAPPLADLNHIGPGEPHPTRIADIRKWMQAIANSADAPVAGIALILTASGTLEAAVRGIEPEHADLVLAQLAELHASLKAWADSQNVPQLQLCNVVRLQP